MKTKVERHTTIELTIKEIEGFLEDKLLEIYPDLNITTVRWNINRDEEVMGATIVSKEEE